jgi:hypothetical protein
MTKRRENPLDIHDPPLLGKLLEDLKHQSPELQEQFEELVDVVLGKEGESTLKKRLLGLVEEHPNSAGQITKWAGIAETFNSEGIFNFRGQPWNRRSIGNYYSRALKRSVVQSRPIQSPSETRRVPLIRTGIAEVRSKREQQIHKGGAAIMIMCGLKPNPPFSLASFNQ